MIGENPLRASEIELVDEFSPKRTPPVTKTFKQLVDRAASNIMQAQAAQKHYAAKRRREVGYEVGDKRDKPRPHDMLEPEGWDPIQGDPQAPEAAEYEAEHLLDNRGEGENEEFLVKWKGFPESAAT
ncbi:hypothetical protein, conserved [Eimeria brunetti]|uniref:Chromo domain-containing protein n=1 Tax=Eimeria brunetti TaxID=51314 RepID=U6LFE3_9EIME|nr:hypothetical protein, conserved [Eimeria brunetti]